MLAGQVVKRYLIPAATIVAESKVKSHNEENIARPSELPIYASESKVQNVCQEQKEQTPGALEDAIKTVRVTVKKYTEEYRHYKKVVFEHLDGGKDRVEGAISYLQREGNTVPKAGAIGIGTLTGLIFGLRGGFFKRTLYATTGALSMSALCYPKEASMYTRTGISEAKKYFTIAYNFIYGVKKDDPPLELPSLPKFPTTFSDAWSSVKSTASSFVSDKQKVVQKPTEEVIESEKTTPV